MTERREFTPEDPAVHSITWDEAYSMTPRENDSMEVSDSLVEELGGHFQSQHYYLHCEVCGESWPCRMQRAATRIESLQETLTQIRAAVNLPAMSPSAPYTDRQAAMEAPGTALWWTQYPHGHLSAAVFRVWRALGMPFWEVEGKELPLLQQPPEQPEVNK